MKDYKEMWEDLKRYIEFMKKYYENGSMCSMSESIYGQSISEDFLGHMKDLEERTEK